MCPRSAGGLMDDEFDSIDDILDSLDLPEDVAAAEGADPEESPSPASTPAPAQTAAEATDDEAESSEVATPEQVQEAAMQRLAELEEKETQRLAQEERDRVAAEQAEAAREVLARQERYRADGQYLREFKAQLDQDSPELGKTFVPFMRDLYGRLTAAEDAAMGQKQVIEAWVYATGAVAGRQVMDEVTELAMGMAGVPRDQMMTFADQTLSQRHAAAKTDAERQAYVAGLEKQLAELKANGRPVTADEVDMGLSGVGAAGKSVDDWTIDDIVEDATRGMRFAGSR